MMQNLLRSVVLCILLLSIWTPPLSVYSQVTVTPITPTNAVNNVLVGGGLSISNISSQGNANQFGEFFAPNTNLNMGHGIVLSTGGLTSSNVLATGAIAGAGSSGYAPLGNNTYNAAMLKFDFIPVGDTLKFEYIFASMEYTGYTCSNYNDVFSFFISGPNPLGGNYNNQNIALIPGTSTPVTINTVNCGQPSGTYNSCPPGGLTHSQYFVQSCPATASQNQGVGFNGFTVPLTAVAAVRPCSTYTLTMAVADVYDGNLNSAVFLKANSFSGGLVTINSSYNYSSANNDTLIYEGCSDVTLDFVKSSVSGSYDTVLVNISGSATNGVDYTVSGGGPFPNQIVFAPGQTSVPITLVPVSDNLAEGPENVTFTVNNVTPCGDTIVSTINFIITDVQPMHVDAGPDVITCYGTPHTFTPVITGGVPPYQQMHWFLNSLGNALGTSLTNYPITQGGMYIYTATNGCNPSEVVYDTVLVTLTPPQFALSFDIDSVSCNGANNGSIDLTVTGPTDPFTYSWTPGSATTQDLSNLAPGTYTVVVTDNIGCKVDSTVTVYEPTNIPISISDKFICSAQPTAINPTPIPNVNYTWSPSPYFTTPTSNNPIFTSNHTGPGYDTVHVHVEVSAPGACGQDDFIIYVAPHPPVAIIQPGYDTLALCPNDTLTLENSANTNLYPQASSYLWSTGATSSSISVSSPGLYWLEVTNVAGCKFRDSLQLVGKMLPVAYTDSVRYICGNQTIPVYAVSYSPTDDLLWSTGATTDTIMVNTAGTYTLIVTNECGSDTVSTQVVQIPTVTPQLMPNIFTPNGDGVNDIYDAGSLFTYSQIFNVQIFNRWGTKIYDTDDKGIHWAPKHISDGVYFMAIIYTDCNNKQQKLAHTVTVISK